MKKILAMLLIIALSVSFIACDKSTTSTTSTSTTRITTTTTTTALEQFPVIVGATAIAITVNDTFDRLLGVSATDAEDGNLTSSIIVTGTLTLTAVGIYTLTYSVTDSDGNLTSVIRHITVNGMDGCEVHQTLVNGICVNTPPVVIVIMHGAVYEIDPFHANYTGTEQLSRQNKQREIEALYNVIIEYRSYPAEAAWGPDRITAIINSSVAGTPLADIYWNVSDWIQQLADKDAIVDVSKYMGTYGNKIDSAYWSVGGYQGGIYGFDSYKPTVSSGLYYNADLVESLGVDNPTDLFLAGVWNWTRFETWATQVQTLLSAQASDMYAIGGMLSYYAEAMIPLNGGSLINANTGRVAFAQNPALETYDFLHNLYVKGLFELNPAYDAGSPAWMAGKVALHPGDLWFMNAESRWGNVPFEIGFVPFPVADDFTGEYVSPISGVALMTLASGLSAAKEELVFKVWNEIQLWKTPAQQIEAFEFSLITKFDDDKYIEAYLAIYDKTYLDLINAIGISAYSESGWTRNINTAIKTGTSRTVVDQIKPVYEAALEKYFGN